MEKSLQRGALRAYATATRSSRPRLSLQSTIQNQLRHQSSVPTIMQPSFWKSLVPKPLRRRPKPTVDWGVPEKKKAKPKEWNPATFFIVIFLSIGSVSVQMIAMKKDFATFMRRAEVRIGLLREVIEKIQRGEEVDVGKALGTGDAQKELEWEDVLREIEQDNSIKTQKRAISAKTPPPPPKEIESGPESVSVQVTETTKPNRGYSNFF